MVIQSAERYYEVIQKLSEGENNTHFKCRSKGDEGGSHLFHLIQLKRQTIRTESIFYIQEIVENSAFIDFLEYFMDENFMYLVFVYPQGEALTAYPAAAVLSLKERFELLKQIMERVLLLMLPLYLQWEVLRPEAIRVVSAETAGGVHNGDVGTYFYYGMEEIAHYGEIRPFHVSEAIRAIFELLFAGEKESGLYPEFHQFEGFLEDSGDLEFIDLYKKYILLMPVFGEERKQVVVKRKPLVSRIKAKMGIIFKCLKIAAGLTVILASAAALIPVWKEKIAPVVVSNYLVKSIVAGTPEMDGYSGKVEISSPGTGQTIWKGRLEEGRRTGYGFQYDSFGRMEYEGEFLADRFNGQGTLYYQDGNIRYRGSFLEGSFDGSGSMFDRSGELLYRGEFLQGEKSGQGTFYDKSGQVLYEGGFSKDMMDGEGTLYQGGRVREKGIYEGGSLVDGQAMLFDDEGKLIYEGEIRNQKRDGEGTAFMGESVIYEGGFKKDQYEGMGKLYSSENGKLLYQGEFLGDVYSGKGVLYNPVTEFPVYDGSFRLGFYDGEGMEYDSRGYLRYQGLFLLGDYSGSGVLYVPETGMVLEEGEFRNGMLVTSKAEPEALAEAEKLEEADVPEESDELLGVDAANAEGAVAAEGGATADGEVAEAEGTSALGDGRIGPESDSGPKQNERGPAYEGS